MIITNSRIFNLSNIFAKSAQTVLWRNREQWSQKLESTGIHRLGASMTPLEPPKTKDDGRINLSVILGKTNPHLRKI